MFKVGDKVQRKYDDPIDCNNYGSLPFGRDFVVIDTSPDGPMTGTVQISDGRTWWDQRRFVLSQLNTNTAKKDDNGKPRFDFLFGLHGLNHLCSVFSVGELKYGDPYNFRKSKSDVSYKLRLVGASLRHIYAYVRGERLDKESGLPHIAHAICNLLMVLDLEEA